MTTLLLLHLAVGLGLVGACTRASRRPGALFALGALPSAVTLAWLVIALPDVIDGEVRTEVVEWIPQLDVDLALRLDGFAALMLVLVAGIGVLVFAYAWRYFAVPTPADGRLVGLLVLFAGAMVGLVLADDLLVLYGFWELTSITSFLLIGNRHEDAAARAAALQALLVTGMGALAMLGGFIVLGQAADTYRLSAILADPPSGTAVSVAVVLILLGAFTKSAQAPFHSWLPGAMAAPTPVSTYLHSATMVKAGVYLIARLAPAFVVLDLWRPVVVTVGVTTMLIGGLRALRQHDLKLLLAYGTVSQLGFMVAVFGWGTAEAMAAGCVTLLAHGAFKAAAFMVVGIIDHEHGTRDLRRLPRPRRGDGPTVVVAAVAAASMAGIPLLFGFVAKEADLDTFAGGGRAATFGLIGITAGSLLTVAYSLRFLAGVTGRLAEREPDAAPPHDTASPALTFVAPAAVLAAFTVLAGVVPGVADGIVSAGAKALDAAAEDVHLALWHGLTTELVLSVVAVAGGVALYAARRHVQRFLALGSFVPPSSGAYRSTLRGINTLANRVTAVAQPGSLPIYVGVILLTAALVPGLLLLSGTWWPGWPALVETPVHLAIAALLIGLALAAAIIRRRFAGALFLGMVGYSMAALFVVQGAPDLALTQIAIETLSTVLFVLVLRRLPDRFETTPGAARRAVRIVIATVVGGVVFAFTLAFGGIDPPTDVSDVMIAEAYPEGEGRNVVNVILVDIRGLDTLGEMTVLTAVAIGTVALARAGRRPAHVEAEAARTTPRARRPPPVARTRLVIVEVSVRIVFAAVMIGSLWLLFAGHNQPGGGFVGGIVAGAAISLRYVAGGLPEVRRLSRGQPWMVLGSGLLISVTTAIVPLLLGGEVLQTGSHTFDLPVIGDMKVTSAMIFDIGVYLAVIGLAMMVFESFGDEPAPPPAESAEAVA